MVTEQIIKKLDHEQMESKIILKDWKIKNIVNHSVLKARIGWQGLTTKEYQKNGKFFLITGTDFENGKINWNSCVYVDEKRYAQDKNIQVKEEDVLVTKDGTIGKIAYVDKLSLPATLNTGVFVIRPKNKDYQPLFLFYILDSNYFNKFLNKLKAGSTINHLYQKDFMDFDFFVPSYSIQEKITKILTDTSQIIEQLEYFITKKKNIKQGVMQELLTGKRRLAGFNDKWKETTLNEIGVFTKGKGIKKTEISDMGLQCIRYGEIYSKYDTSVEETLSNIPIEIAKKSQQIKNGDLLFTGSGETPDEIGKCIVYLGKKLCYAGGDIIIFSVNGNNPLFLAFLLNFDYVQKQKTSMAQGDMVVHIYSSSLKKLKIKIPQIPEQIAISKILFDIDSEIQELETKRDKYIMLKNGMMQKLLTGEIRLV